MSLAKWTDLQILHKFSTSSFLSITLCVIKLKNFAFETYLVDKFVHSAFYFKDANKIYKLVHFSAGVTETFFHYPIALRLSYIILPQIQDARRR